MTTKMQYLTQSKTGWYEYRRRIPQNLRPAFGNLREFKRALRTTSLNEAAIRWVAANKQFTDIVDRARRLQDPDGNRLSEDVLVAARTKAKMLEPPILRAGASIEERKAFDEAEKAWLVAMEEAKSEVADNYLDFDALQRSYDDGRFFKPDYKTPYFAPRGDDPAVLALRNVEGGIPLDLRPTWHDAIDNYLRIHKTDTGRDSVSQATFEKKTRSLLNKFGLSLGKQGNATPLDQISRQHARSFKEQYSTATGNKNNNVLSAVVNSWNKENAAKAVDNHFTGLTKKKLEDQQSTKRRSFSPSQWSAYVAKLKTWRNPEIGLIGLIMAYTGCRTSEAAGLAVLDVRLDDEVPNLIFRNNEVRTMEKNGLERAVPIFAPLVELLKTYRATNPQTSSFFKKYGAKRHYTNVSKQLNDIIREKLLIADKELVAYSFRHTIIDKARAAGLDNGIAQYLVGHKTSESSRIHGNYGTRTPPKANVDHLRRILDQAVWDTGAE